MMSLIKHGLILMLFVFVTGSSFAENKQGEEKTHHETQNEKFSPGDFIFDHINDSYGWHIAGHFSIPLPVILYSQRKGWVVFLSSKLEHGHAAYKGFEISHEAPHEGKVVLKLPDGSFEKPFDISITKNIMSLFLGAALILFVFLKVAKLYVQNEGKAPSGIQSIMEPIILFIRDEVAKPAIGEKKYEKFLPYLLTLFFFIFFNNILGLIPVFPGGANVTGNIAVTMVLALFTFVITNINGNKNYWLHVFNPPGVPVWLKIPPIMPAIELIGVLTKPFVLMIRLFANITAGHIIVLGFYSLIFILGEMNPVAGYSASIVTVAFNIFMSFLELLVAFVQAFVFTVLSAIYFGMAVEEHH